MGENEVKIIAVYYCSYCIFTVFRKRKWKKKKKEKFFRIHYSLCKRLLMIISAFLMCKSRSRSVVPLLRYPAIAIEKPEKDKSYQARARHRKSGSFRRHRRGASPCRNKQGQAIRVVVADLSSLPN
jgi:hypothetical protein